MTRHIKFFLIASLALAVVFAVFPSIDLWVSKLFYKQSEGFYLNHHPALVLIHESVPYLVGSLAVAYFSLLGLSFMNRHPVAFLTKRKLCYLIAVMVVGPGLMVNSFFKDQWGRARPLQIEQFGGDKQFSIAFMPSDQCKRNCSFTSGDASVGFALFSWALLATRRKRIFYIGALSAGGVIGVARIMQGAHFLSDVIFSGVFVYLVAYILHHKVFKT